jgi:hypothetical protein
MVKKRELAAAGEGSSVRSRVPLKVGMAAGGGVSPKEHGPYEECAIGSWDKRSPIKKCMVYT